jgi:hypothetical protein
MKGKLVFEPKQSDTPGTCHFAHDLAHALSNTWGSDHIDRDALPVDFLPQEEREKRGKEGKGRYI